MLYEPTILASVARLIGETLERDYGISPEPIFKETGIESAKFHLPGARVSVENIDKLWDRAIAATGDQWIGFKVGENFTPVDFFVLGHAWLASATLADALQRLCRYGNIVSTDMRSLELRKQGDCYALIETYSDNILRPGQVSEDAGYVALLKLCDIISRRTVRPVSVSLPIPIANKSTHYDELFQCPVNYGKVPEVWLFSADDIEEPLTGSIPDVASATDGIAARYLASLDQGAVATAVRQLLIDLLPGGSVDQEKIAYSLHRSASTLQRQLNAEGTSYREILESTRRSLSEQYLENGEYSQAQIAFMVGFSDQSNFSRAFKRWTGLNPRQFQSESTD